MKKKLIITLFALLLACGIAGTFWGPNIAEAASSLWGSCPKGKVNDYYPGDCHDYIDTNRDNICDRSQANPAAVSPVQTTAPAAATPAVTATSAVTTPEVTAFTPASTSTGGKSYYLIPVGLGCVVLYGATWILSARKKIKTLTHRKIWNIVLLITMAGSAILGLERILVKDFNLNVTMPFDALFWHVEISIILGVVGLFHIIWHWRYFSKMLGKPDKQGAA